MHMLLRTAAVWLLVAGGAAAAEPVVVELHATANPSVPVVTVSDVARVSGGDATMRERVARLDLLELKPRELKSSVSRRVIEYRLALAGIDADAVQFAGADRVAIERQRRKVTVEEAVAAAKTELRRHLPNARIDLAQPVAATIPEAPNGADVVITAKTHSPNVTAGRVQMDVTILCGGQVLFALPVHLEAAAEAHVLPTAGKSSSTWPELPSSPGMLPADIVRATTPLPPLTPIQPAAGTGGAGVLPGETLVRSRHRITMQVKSGALFLSMPGEAMQDGRLGQTIAVQNIDTKKPLTARVTGPGLVEVDLGGTP